jgi:hypothetical protein
MHAGLADAETATTLPAKEKFLPAAVTLLEGFAAFSPIAYGAVFGAQSFTSLTHVQNGIHVHNRFQTAYGLLVVWP